MINWICQHYHNKLKAENQRLDLEKRNLLSELQRTIAGDIFIEKNLELEVENQRLTEALKEIKEKEGRVCPGYEICEHNSCRSSYNSWAIADRALWRNDGKSINNQ